VLSFNGTINGQPASFSATFTLLSAVSSSAALRALASDVNLSFVVNEFTSWNVPGVDQPETPLNVTVSGSGGVYTVTINGVVQHHGHLRIAKHWDWRGRRQARRLDRAIGDRRGGPGSAATPITRGQTVELNHRSSTKPGSSHFFDDPGPALPSQAHSTNLSASRGERVRSAGPTRARIKRAISSGEPVGSVITMAPKSSF
jgi:hypothetical protein